jgi:hypothetical protein
MMKEKLFFNTLPICPLYIQVFLSFKYCKICTKIYNGKISKIAWKIACSVPKLTFVIEKSGSNSATITGK